MWSARPLAVLALSALLAVACSSSRSVAITTTAPTSGAASSPATAAPSSPASGLPSPAPPSATPFSCSGVSQPSAEFPPSAPSNRNLALVRLGGANQTVVRDVTDINHPSTVAVLDIPSRSPVFVSATDVSWSWDDMISNIYRHRFASKPTLVAQCSWLFDWSSGGTSMVYVFADERGTTIHQRIGGRDQVLGSIPNLPVIGCDSQSCVDNWDFRLLYSPDGTEISLVEGIGESVFRIWTADGKLLKSVDSKSPMTMSVWSGSSLYFRDAAGVEAWHKGTTSLILPGVAWISPKASSGGGQIVYTVRETSGLPSVNVLDTASGKARLLVRSRSGAVFLTPRNIWYRGERLCAAGDQCPTGPTIATGKTYIYDLQTGLEMESIITDVADVWPHGA
jgi:hypothetical protein